MSNMVKNLLSEQAELKNKLAAQEEQISNFKHSKKESTRASANDTNSVATGKRSLEVRSSRMRQGQSAQPKSQLNVKSKN